MNRITTLLLAGAATVALSSATYAADLIIDQPMTVSPGVVNTTGNWEGVYLGAFVGYAAGSLTDNDHDYFDAEDSMNVSGAMVGVRAGADFYLTDGVVGGVVGDIAWANITGSNDYYPTDYTAKWEGSLRAKLGFDAGAFMPYLTGGLAVANGQVDIDGYKDSQTHVGWTVGAGVEVAVTDDVSLDLLYRYSDYGSKDYDTYYSGSSLGLTSHAVTLGVNWRF